MRLRGLSLNCGTPKWMLPIWLPFKQRKQKHLPTQKTHPLILRHLTGVAPGFYARCSSCTDHSVAASKATSSCTQHLLIPSTQPPSPNLGHVSGPDLDLLRKVHGLLAEGKHVGKLEGQKVKGWLSLEICILAGQSKHDSKASSPLANSEHVKCRAPEIS